MEGLLACGAIIKLTEEQAQEPERVWNPVNVVESGDKKRFTIHCLENVYYRRPEVELPSVLENTERFRATVRYDIN